MSVDDDILTPEEAAELLKLPLEILLRMSREREIECVPPETFGIKKTDPEYSAYFRYVRHRLIGQMVDESLLYQSDEEEQ